jgi:hypothetical protein
MMKYFAHPKKENCLLNFFPWACMTSLMIMITLLKPLHGGITGVVHFRETLVIELTLCLDQNLLKNDVQNILLIRKLVISHGALPSPEHLTMFLSEFY